MTIAGEALSGVGLWITRRERRHARDDAAVRSVLTAVASTKLYLAHLDRGEALDREVEGGLVEYWTDAAINIRRTDPRLAKTLLRKAEYWTNPENWSSEDVAANRIQIDAIAAEGERLLRDV